MSDILDWDIDEIADVIRGLTDEKLQLFIDVVTFKGLLEWRDVLLLEQYNRRQDGTK